MALVKHVTDPTREKVVNSEKPKGLGNKPLKDEKGKGAK